MCNILVSPYDLTIGGCSELGFARLVRQKKMYDHHYHKIIVYCLKYAKCVLGQCRQIFLVINAILCGGVDPVFEGWHGWCAAAPCRCSSGLSTFQSRWEVSAGTQKLCQLPRPVSLIRPWKNSRTARKDEWIILLQLDAAIFWQEETGRPTSKSVRTSWELSTGRGVKKLVLSMWLKNWRCAKEKKLQIGAFKQARRQGGTKLEKFF